MRERSGEEGVVLLMVLTVIVLTISAVYGFARTSMLGVMAQRQRMHHTRAELLARSGIDVGIRAVIDDATIIPESAAAGIESPEDPWHRLGLQRIAVEDEGELRIRVRDIAHKISLNALISGEGEPHEDSRPFLIAALERIIDKAIPGRPEDKLYDIEDIADGILDWIDSNEEARLGDSELEKYEKAVQTPPNRPLWTLGELAGVPGIDDRLLQALDAYFTSHPFSPTLSGGVNPNTAGAHVLSLIYQGSAGDMRLLDEDGVFAILRARSQGQIFCPDSTEEPCVSYQSEVGRVGEAVFPPMVFQSQLFEIKAEASFSEARGCAAVVVDRRDLAEIRTLAYRTGC